MKKSSTSIWGFLLIILGLIFTINVISPWTFHIFFRGWWTLFIIVPCVISVSKNGFNPMPTTGLIIGILLLLSEWHIIPSSFIWRMFFPIILIVFGISLILKDSSAKNKMRQNGPVNSQSDVPDYRAILGSQKINYDDDTFIGATIDSIFGGMELNLRNAYFQEDVVINCTSIFGGINIFVPSNINVKVSCVPILGGVSNRIKNNNPNAPTLFINATCMFGGIDIK